MTNTFVGEERKAIVENLVDAFRRVEAGEGSRVVVLSSPPGWGKTRIVHEFYKKLAASQQVPAYWPPSIVSDARTDTTDIDGLTRARKVVYPATMTVPDDARMEWMWWGVSCSEGSDGSLRQAFFEHYGQIRAHSYGLVQLDAGGVAGSGIDIGAALFGLAGVFGMAAAPVAPVVTFAGAAKVAWDHRDLPARFGDWLQRRWASSGGRSIELARSANRQDEIDEIVDNLVRLTSRMPTVIIIDDAHFGDEGLREIVDGVVRRKGSKVLIVATAWPSHLDQSETDLPFCVWARQFAVEQPELYARVELQPLRSDDLEELVRAELPAAAQFSDKLFDRYDSNLLAVRAVLRLPHVRRLAEDGDLTHDAFTALPKKVRNIFEEYWRILPQEIRTVLSVSAQAPGLRYLPDLVASVCDRRGLIDHPRKFIAEVINPYAWAHEIDNALHSFIEPVLHDVARDEAQELLVEKDVAAFQAAIVDAAGAIESADALGPAQEEVFRQHVALARDGHIPAGDGAARSAFLLAGLSADQFAFDDAVRFVELGIGWGSVRDTMEMMQARTALGTWLCDLARPSEAINVYLELIADAERVFGQLDRRTLQLQTRLADALLMDGQRHKALELLERLHPKQTQVLGRTDRDTLLTSRSLAIPVGTLGKMDDAIRVLHDVLRQQDLHLGTMHPDTLETVYHLTSLLHLVGSPREAVLYAEPLLEYWAINLPPEHPQVLDMRLFLAEAYLELDRYQDAITICEEYRAAMKFASVDKDEFRVETLYASALLGDGRAEEAVRVCEDLIADTHATFVKDPTSMLEARLLLGKALTADGRSNEAIGILTTLIDDHTRILGEEGTVNSRLALANALREVGRTREAITIYQELVPALERDLGPDDEDMEEFRQMLRDLIASDRA